MRILNSELMPNILLSDKTSIEYSNTDVTQMSHTGKMGIWGGGGGGIHTRSITIFPYALLVDTSNT